MNGPGDFFSELPGSGLLEVGSRRNAMDGDEFAAEVAAGGEAEEFGDAGGEEAAFEHAAGDDHAFGFEPLFRRQTDVAVKKLMKVAGGASKPVSDGVEAVTVLKGEGFQRMVRAADRPAGADAEEGHEF